LPVTRYCYRVCGPARLAYLGVSARARSSFGWGGQDHATWAARVGGRDRLGERLLRGRGCGVEKEMFRGALVVIMIYNDPFIQSDAGVARLYTYISLGARQCMSVVLALTAHGTSAASIEMAARFDLCASLRAERGVALAPRFLWCEARSVCDTWGGNESGRC
jgi:hypothetical protein